MSLALPVRATKPCTHAESLLAFVAYSPLGRGFFTGHFKKLDDLPADDGRQVT
jgi:hypothetical protein